MKKVLLIVLAVIVIAGLYYWMTYNRLVSANEGINNQWAQVQTQLQRRFDLIPNLVASVKGVMAQEQKVFGDLADARTKYGGAVTVDEKAAAATQVEGAFGRLLAVMENYPQLKSAENVQTLMAQLEGTENRIAVERKNYNDQVKVFNVMIKQVPAAWIAGQLGFGERTYFQAEEGATTNPKVDLQN